MNRIGNGVLSAAVAFAACAGVGCGDSSGMPAPSTTVRMGFSAWPGWFPWQIAVDENLFEQTGAMVELEYYDNYTESIEDLASGELDANTQTLNDTLISVAGGDSQVIVLVNDNSTGNDQCIAREGIRNVSDLAGRDVAVEFGVVDHFLLLLALRRSGVDPSSVNIINEATDVAAENFKNGMYDATCVFAPFTSTALERDGSFSLITSRTFPGAIPDYLVVSRELAENNPGDVQALVDTWWLIRKFMEENPERSLEILTQRAGVSTEEYNTYAEGTTLFTLGQNLEALGDPPSDCDSLGTESGRYTECVAREIATFLKDDAMLVTEEISDEELSATWTDRFVKDYADRNPDN